MRSGSFLQYGKFMDISATKSPCQGLRNTAVLVRSLPLFSILTGVNKSLKVKAPSSSCKQSVCRPQVRGCTADNRMPSRPSSSSDKVSEKEGWKCRQQPTGLSCFRSFQSGSQVRHSDSKVSSSGAPAPKLCVTLGVLPDLSVLNVVIHETEMTISLRFIKASMSKYL